MGRNEVIFTLSKDPAIVSSESGAAPGSADAEVYAREVNPAAPEMPGVEREP